MDALILAAGLGQRIREVAPCKPLIQLNGMPLIEIAVRQLAAAGATRVIVATGYRADEVEATLPAIAARTNISVEARRVSDYRRPNGHSVLAGSDEFDGPFLLVMADHILSTQLLARLTHASTSDAGAVLAIDRRTTSPLIDPEDATWVEIGNGDRIVRIGKTIECYNAVDCGAFLASPALPEAIRAAIRDGAAGSLSDGMQRLADEGRARTVDIEDSWWIDVDDLRALELAKAQLCKQLPELFKYSDGTRCVPEIECRTL